MEDYLAMSSSDCAENYGASLSKLEKATSGVLGVLNSATFHNGLRGVISSFMLLIYFV